MTVPKSFTSLESAFEQLKTSVIGGAHQDKIVVDIEKIQGLLEILADEIRAPGTST